MENCDKSLLEAVKLAENLQTITPIVKEELKLTILSRRHLSGKGEIKLEDKKPAIKRELTEDEVKKKLRRKEQNRRAAERCRIKKKKFNEQLIIDYVNEQKKTETLTKEILNLREEKEKLQRMLDEHAFVCNRPPTPSPSYEEQTVFFDPDFPSCLSSAVPQENEVLQSACAYTCEQTSDHFDILMYPQHDDTKPTLFATCTAPGPVEDLPELIPEDLIFLQPLSPDLGRRSVSDYNEDFLNH